MKKKQFPLWSDSTFIMNIVWVLISLLTDHIARKVHHSANTKIYFLPKTDFFCCYFLAFILMWTNHVILKHPPMAKQKQNLKFSQVFKVRQYLFQNYKGKINNTGLNGLEKDEVLLNFKKWSKEEIIHYLFELFSMVSSVCQYS